uniref:Agenet domain-containing protein n=1 Tax=Solanum lycopersicum TaxID=4081 RepID=A0A3Q7HYS4_SOLLC|nr:DUF724 domain-containing protein 3-like [Solanum lycopersicum]
MANRNDVEKNHKRRVNVISMNIRKLVYKRQEASRIFQRNDEVEAVSEEKGYLGSYYRATILYPVGNCSDYRVKYKTLVNDDQITPLEWYVRASELRPVPPEISRETKPMETYDIVDAYDKEGWWIGVITGKVEQEYRVYFPTSKEEIVFSADKLRFHQEWSDGEWKFPSFG